MSNSDPNTVDLIIIKLNCLVLGDDRKHRAVFEIKIARTESVSALQDLIKEKKKHALRDVDADRLELWKVNDTPVDDTFQDRLENLRADLDHQEPLSPVDDMLDVFDKEGPLRKHLHIIVRVPPAVSMAPPPPPSLANLREQYVNQRMEPPSKAGIPSKFAKLQEKPAYQIFCSRPRDVADPIPVTLLEPVFAQFVDDCQNYEPIDDDHAFVTKLSHEMCKFYPSESKRLHDFRRIFETYGITLHAGAVGSSLASTDGHLLGGTHVKVILEGKNEIGSGGAEPFAEAMLYYREFLQFVEDRQNMFEEHNALLPCFHIICIGACIGILGTVFSTKVQCDILVPIIPLFWHSTDLPTETIAVRTLAAFKVAVKRLEALPTTTPPKPLRGDGTIIYPYPRDYVDSADIPQTFTYDKDQPFRERLIFYGKTTGGARICVKFTRMYSPHAHRFCASKGHAPKLIACKPLPGGWNMIVMDFIDIHYSSSPYRGDSYQYFSRDIPGILSMEESITTLIKGLHAEGYVHSDIRDANVFVQVQEVHEGVAISNFMLVDFDWAGPVGRTKYPLGVNRLGIYRPENARGGCQVLVEDDLDMLRSLFRPVGQKRKRSESR